MEVMKVCQAFIEIGHEIRLWVPGPPASRDAEHIHRLYGLRESVPIQWLRVIGPARHYDFALRACVAARAWGADWLYLWPLQAAALAALMRWPFALELHDRPGGRVAPKLMGRILHARGKKRLLPITDALRTWLENHFGVELNPPDTVVLPSGVDLHQYQDLPPAPEARRSLGLAERFTAGYTGHLYPGRGMPLLLALAERNPEIQFVWAGGEPEAIESWSRRLEASGVGNVRMLGFVPNQELPLVQAACDVLLMPYEERVAVSSGGDTAAFASPMKLFEYLASGRAILSSDLPVLREILNPANAMLLPPADIEAWDGALKEIMGDPGRREALARRARQDALRYDWRARARRALEGLHD